MSRSERDKGVRGEREVAVFYREHGFVVNRTPNSGGLLLTGDLYGQVPEHIEVKRQETTRPWIWIAQAERDSAGQPWVVAFRRSRSTWYAITTLERHVSLVRSEANERADTD